MKYAIYALAFAMCAPALAIKQPTRQSQYPVIEPILCRWSPHAFSGEKITDKELMTLFEAARWAPSSYNDQPWKFLYARNGSKQWKTFFDLMVPFNQSWAQRADVLVVVISRTTFEHNGTPSITHSFDTGAAAQNLALQAHTMGLAAHGMGGFDYERARKDLNIPEGYAVEAMIAIGKPGSPDLLPEEMRANEKPSTRKPLCDIMHEGAL